MPSLRLHRHQYSRFTRSSRIRTPDIQRGSLDTKEVQSSTPRTLRLVNFRWTSSPTDGICLKLEDIYRRPYMSARVRCGRRAYVLGMFRRHRIERIPSHLLVAPRNMISLARLFLLPARHHSAYVSDQVDHSSCAGRLPRAAWLS